MAHLSRDQILTADDLKTEELEVPEWGGSVLLRMLTGAERDAFEASTVQGKLGSQKQNLNNLRARLLILCIVNERGEREFNRNDIDALGAKSSVALQRVFNRCNEMNGLSDDDIEELTQDFATGPSVSSTSDSPSA